MENNLKSICSFIHSLTTLESTITNNKLSYSEVDKLFSLVDVKGRGHLDLGDVYDLVGKVSEDELFMIFKYLDKNRTGQIRAEELKKVFGDECSKSNQLNKQYIFPKFYKVVDAIREKPKATIQAKKKINLNNDQLKQVYTYLCELVQSKYLTLREFATVMKAQSMKYGLMWGNEHEKVMVDMVGSQSMTESKFIECFGSDNKIKIEDEEENLLSDIQDYSTGSIYSTNKRAQIPARPSQHAERVSPITLSKSQHQSQNASIIYSKTNNYVKPLDTPSFRNNVPQEHQKSPEYRGKRQFDQIEGNINEVLGAIQQRRQKLRQDSLERKKIIDEVMNRKKELCGKGYSSPKNETQWKWKEPEMTYNGNSNLKLQCKTYLKQNNYMSSSPKQPGYPDMQQYAPKPKRDSFKGFNSYSSQINNDHAQMYTPVSPYKGYAAKAEDYSYGAGYEDVTRKRPSTPTAQVGMDISDILRKYNNKEEDSNTLKQMCKSKSGFLYSQPVAPYNKYGSKYPSQISEPYDGKWQGQEYAFSAKSRAASKENVMKRAEQEAARKIQEIERKARMKVLEKKNILGRNQNRDWKALTKKGAYY